MVDYLEWLVNVVPVLKKDRRVRIYVDYRDLNKACPKDDFLYLTSILWWIVQLPALCTLSWMVSRDTIR